MADEGRRNISDAPVPLQGGRLIGRISHVLARLHGAGAERDRAGNRRLFYDQYVSLLLLYFFNPAIKSLRAYHESEILVPARVDPQTGYRSYTVDQLADAAIVQRLRALDLPLGQVRSVLDARDPDVTRRVLAAHQREMQSRLDETERIVAELQSVVAPTTHTPVHLRTETATQSVRVSGLVPADEFADWLSWAFGELGSFLQQAGVEPSGPPGGLYAAELVDDGPEAAEAFLPIDAGVVVPTGERHVAIGEVPATRAAVLVHTGAYETIDPKTERFTGNNEKANHMLGREYRKGFELPEKV